MKLYYSAGSPFVRKVNISAIILGLDDDIEFVDTDVTPGKENVNYAKRINPLGKIPVLETNDGLMILDSTVICEYLNDLEGNNRMIPAAGAKRWKVQTSNAIANGIMDAAVLNRYETHICPKEYRWTQRIDERWLEISNSLNWFNNKKLYSIETIDEISLACALGYLDFRFKEFSWRDKYSNLCEWHKLVSKKLSYKNTTPK